MSHATLPVRHTDKFCIDGQWAALSWMSGCARPPGCSGRDAAVHLCHTTAPALTWMSCQGIYRLAELPNHPYPIGLRPVTSRWTER